MNNAPRPPAPPTCQIVAAVGEAGSGVAVFHDSKSASQVQEWMVLEGVLRLSRETSASLPAESTCEGLFRNLLYVRWAQRYMAKS